LTTNCASTPGRDADPALGTVELWKIRAQNVEHPIHIHLAPFQVIAIGGSDPGPYNQGWKDTVNLNNGDYATLLVPSTATGAGMSSTATTWNTRTCR
jgi:spore coat protein A